MPKPKRKNTNSHRGSKLVRNDSVMINSTNQNEKQLQLRMWRAEVQDKMHDAIIKLTDMEKEKLEVFEHSFRNSLMTIPKYVLNTEINMDNEEFINSLLGIKEEVEDEPLSPVALPTVKRRSRSACNVKVNMKISQRIHRLRSTSVDVYKTPNGKARVSSIMTNNKYTVSKPRKPVENSGVRLKRIMKPNEEAISTCGSPLHVVSANLNIPHVNIPLPGGVVLNIEPKSAKGPLEIPELDSKIKDQIKLLCDQLEQLI